LSQVLPSAWAGLIQELRIPDRPQKFDWVIQNWDTAARRVFIRILAVYAGTGSRKPSNKG